MAVLASAGRTDNLAVLARLAAAAAAIDSALRETALLVAAAGDPRRAPALGMTVAPPVDDPRRWTRPTSGGGCVEAIGAARSWLTRHGEELTVGQLATTARAALAITHYLGHIHTHTTPDFPVTADLVAAARPWRAVLQATAELRSPVPVSPHTPTTPP
jgi:hypothetical protein